MNRWGQRLEARPVQTRPERVHLSVTTVVLIWLVKRLFRLLWWLTRRPLILAAALLVYGGVRLVEWIGPVPPIAGGAVIGLGLVGWWRRWPDSYSRLVGCRVRGGWRRLWLYRMRWQSAVTSTGLDLRFGDDKVFIPRLASVRSTRLVDRVTVRLLPGQVIEDYAAAGDRLAATFGAIECRVRSVPGRRDRMVLWFLVRDPLIREVQTFTVADDPDLHALPVALQEDGGTYRLPLQGSHLLLAGATGAGKSSIVWSLLSALGGAIRSGLVQVWAIDPKGGMELAFGERLFHRFWYGQPDDTDANAAWEIGCAQVLEDAVTVMRRRETVLRGHTRLHQPSVEEPLVVVIIDELAALTAYCTDRDARRRIAAALALLLSQGRAVGVTVIGALQDPRKDVLPFRDLFPLRIALRVTESEHVDMILGAGAPARGARCDAIPETLPGVGYVVLDGIAEPIRVRFAYLTDSAIDTFVTQATPTPAISTIDVPLQAVDDDDAAVGDDRQVAA